MPSFFQTPKLQRRSNDPRRATIGWWGITSIVSALLAAAFIPASMLSDGNWGGQISLFAPIWAACCIFGAGTGIHGLQKQRRATPLQRRLAFAGTLLSLIFFIVLTIIALIAMQ